MVRFDGIHPMALHKATDRFAVLLIRGQVSPCRARWFGERLRHLVVMIPGIGGSVLETTGGSPIWGQRPRALAGALIDPARLSLAEHPILRPW